jgi:hypothetical protein
MAELPCAFCGQHFLGAAVTAYWAWYEGEERISFQQKAMPECAFDQWDPWLCHALDRAKGTAIWPDKCPVCGDPFEETRMPLYATIYKGKVRRDLVVPHCSACMSKAFPVITLNAQRLPERSLVAGSRGAPTSGPTEEPGEKDELPW